jgi:outer membrane lipoprotein-sorting protein
MRSVLAALTLLICAQAVAAEDLATLLATATAAARPRTTVRGDGELVTTSPDGVVRDQLAVVYRPNGDRYFELRRAGTRALLLGDGSAAFIVPAAGKTRAPFAADAPFDGTELTREDLQPFNAGAYGSPTIADRSENDVTVSLTPHPSQYTLQVFTFDSAKHVPLVVKSYKDTVSNLVKMLRLGAYTSVDGSWMPGDMQMENFPLRVTNAVELHWRPTEDTPALFDRAALDKPSTLTWPDTAPTEP